MANVRGKDSQFWATDSGATQREYSTFLTSVDSTLESDIHDTTTMGGTSYKSSIRGFLGYSGSLSGIYDDAATVTPDEWLTGLITAAATVTSTVTFAPRGSTSAKPYERAAVYFQNYKKSSAVDGMVTWSVDYQLASGSLTRATF